MNRRLLAVSPVSPWPTDNGLSLRVYNILRHLATSWEAVLVFPSADDNVPEPLAELDLAAIVPVRVDAKSTQEPWLYDTTPVREKVAELTRSGFDAALLWFGTDYLAVDAKRFPPALVDCVDSWTLQAWRKARRARGLRERASWLREMFRMAAQERRVGKVARRLVVVSPLDRRWLERTSGSRTVSVVANGVEPDDLRLKAEALHPTIVFTGVMEYGPNVQAVLYFARRIWPAIRSGVPDARLLIVGRDPTPAVSRLSRLPGIEVTGRVESVQPFLRRAWVAVAPMVSGAGIQNKILEAWACGTPVVMSPIANAGVADQRMAPLVAGAPGPFAERVISLLRDEAKRRAFGALGFGIAADDYSWYARARAFSELLAGMAPGAHPTRISNT